MASGTFKHIEYLIENRLDKRKFPLEISGLSDKWDETYRAYLSATDANTKSFLRQLMDGLSPIIYDKMVSEVMMNGMEKYASDTTIYESYFLPYSEQEIGVALDKTFSNFNGIEVGKVLNIEGVGDVEVTKFEIATYQLEDGTFDMNIFYVDPKTEEQSHILYSDLEKRKHSTKETFDRVIDMTKWISQYHPSDRTLQGENGSKLNMISALGDYVEYELSLISDLAIPKKEDHWFQTKDYYYDIVQNDPMIITYVSKSVGGAIQFLGQGRWSGNANSLGKDLNMKLADVSVNGMAGYAMDIKDVKKIVERDFDGLDFNIQEIVLKTDNISLGYRIVVDFSKYMDLKDKQNEHEFRIGDKVVWTYDFYDKKLKKDIKKQTFGVVESFSFDTKSENPLKIYVVKLEDYGWGDRKNFLDKSHKESKRHFGEDIKDLSKVSDVKNTDSLKQDEARQRARARIRIMKLKAK